MFFRDVFLPDLGAPNLGALLGPDGKLCAT